MAVENDRWVLEIGEDGRLVTSTLVDYGENFFGVDEYVYRESREPITSDAHDSRVGHWMASVGSEKEAASRQFYVGTRDQLETWLEEAKAFCDEQRLRCVRPTRFILPESYTGWVEIEHGTPGAPPAPYEDHHYLFEIGDDGRLVTSTPLDCTAPPGEREDYRFANSGEPITYGAYQSRIGYWRPGPPFSSVTECLRSPDRFFVGSRDQWESWKLEQKAPRDR